MASSFWVASLRTRLTHWQRAWGRYASLIHQDDMPSVSTMVSRGTESHNLVFMNVKRDAARKNVTAFAAKIDDKAYEFPKDSCSKK